MALARQPSSSQLSNNLAFSIGNDNELGIHTVHESVFTPESTGDVVAVHGFNARLTDSWRSARGKFWLQDFLGRDMPYLNVMTFGYRTNGDARVKTIAENLVTDLCIEREGKPGGRPLIFIGQDIGGIVIKKALLLSRAHTNESKQKIYHDTRAIVFFGTAHQGKIEDISVHYRMMMAMRMSSGKLLGGTILGDPDLEKSNRLFRSMEQYYKLACYFASLPNIESGQFTVSPGVAVLAGAENIRRDVLQSEIGKFDSSGDVEYKRLLSFLKQIEPLPSDTLRSTGCDPIPANLDAGMGILCLDGGGVRGLSSLLVIRDLMYEIQKTEHLKDLPRPCEYFDLICGTSTGGLIAIMLGRLRMDVISCIVAYEKLSKDVFELKTWTMWATGAWNFMTGNGWFSATALEQAVTEILQYRLPMAESVNLEGIVHEASLRDPLGGRCNIFVCAVDTDTHDCARLRSYDVPGIRMDDDLRTCTIIEAARATAAAPTYFPTAKIGKSTFFDGAMKNNNPIIEAVKELAGPLNNPPVRCLVSIGTGTTEHPPYRPGMIGLVKALTRLAVDTEAKHQEIMTNPEYASVRSIYFRFNVDGLGDVDLSSWQKLPEIRSKTKEMLSEYDTKESLKECAALLVQS